MSIYDDISYCLLDVFECERIHIYLLLFTLYSLIRIKNTQNNENNLVLTMLAKQHFNKRRKHGSEKVR